MGVSRLNQTGFGDLLKTVGLDENAEMGMEHTVSRSELLDALRQLILAARKVPNGFQVRARGFCYEPEEFVCKGLSGLHIDGTDYYIMCNDDYWQMWPMETSPLPPGKQVPPEMRGEERREEAEIPTENCEMVRVEIKKGRSDLASLLSKVRKFAESAPDESLCIIIG